MGWVGEETSWSIELKSGIGWWGIERTFAFYVIRLGSGWRILISIPNPNSSRVFHTKPIPVPKLNGLGFTRPIWVGSGSFKLAKIATPSHPALPSRGWTRLVLFLKVWDSGSSCYGHILHKMGESQTSCQNYRSRDKRFHLTIYHLSFWLSESYHHK